MAIKKVICVFITILLVFSMLPAFTLTAYAAFDEKESGTWFETAYATWTGTDDSYSVYVKALNAYDWRDDSPITGWLTDWEKVDSQLVRKVDAARGIWRVDIMGLPKGEYEIQVRAANGSTVLYTFDNLETRSFPRNGAGFAPSNDLTYGGSTFTSGTASHNFAPNGAIGGYLPDGRVDPNAKIIYVTHENMNETLPSNIFSANRGSTANARTPLVIRFLGTVGSFDTVAVNGAAAGTKAPPAAVSSRMLSVGSGNGNVTFEGVGPDATIFGWGINTSSAHNVVFRNLNFDQWYDDAIFLSGGSNFWVHNNTFGYGQNKFLALAQDPDQAKGDGATDISNNARNYTVSYNYYAGSSKVLLIGGGASMAIHYGTLDHNWFQGSEERTPRVRNGRVHVFNNLYEDIQGHEYHNQLLERNTGYGIGAGHSANVWAEGNIFENVNFPFLRSRQGHARGHQPIDYVAQPGEASDKNAGFNHFFGDQPGYILTKEVVTDGDFPDSIDGFRQASDYTAGLTNEALAELKADALNLQPNVFDDSSKKFFDPELDIGIVVASGSTTQNPVMTASPAGAFDWAFRPEYVQYVWPTGTQAEIDALRYEVENYAGAIPELSPSEAPAAPAISSVTINAKKLSATSANYIPTALTVVYENTFTIEWDSNDAQTAEYEIQWDKGNDEWETIANVPASARPNSFITQDVDQFAHLKEILAEATDKAAVYSFKARAINSEGASDWSEAFSLRGDGKAFANISFDYAGGEGDVTSKQVLAGEAYGELPTAVYEGYRFVGWSTDGTEDGIVTAAAIASSSCILTAVWEDDYSDGKARLMLNGPDIITVEENGAEYILSAANLNKLATITLWFEVDGDYFECRDIIGFNGLQTIGGITWTNPSGTTWNGRVTLGILDGSSLTSSEYIDLIKLTLAAKEENGSTSVKITRVDLSGYDNDNKAVYIDSLIRKDSVATNVIEYFSPYDVNRDGKVDQLDLTTAQLYYAAKADEPNWNEAKIADVNADERVDIEDFILILNNIVW